MATNPKSSSPEGSTPYTPGRIRVSEGKIPSVQPESISKFRLVAELGRGGMGNVYLAVVSGPAGFNKLQVIKRLRSELAQDQESVTMFLDEARLAARLSHPNVVQTNEVGQDGSHFFISMEYLEGQSLDQINRRARATGEKIPLAINLRILCDALAGLHYAHELADFDGSPLGLVHRDATPQNLFVTYDGISKLLDFGIAKAATSAHETRAGTFKGKCAYMPPEQIVGDSIDRRADVFSMGAVLWQAAAGERLWKGESDMRIFHRVVNGEIPSPLSVNPDVPPELERICMRALSVRKDDRFASAADMQAALERFIESNNLQASDRDVSRFINRLFAEDRAAMKAAVDAQLRELSKASDPRQLVPLAFYPQSDDDPGSLSAAHRAISHGSRGSLKAAVVEAAPPYSAPPARFGSRHVAVAIGATAVAVLGLVAVMRGRPSSAPADDHATVAAAAAPATVAIPATAQTPEPELVVVHISAKPASARLFVDDAPLGANPADNKFLRDGASHLVRAEAPGYRTKSQLVPFKSDHVNVDLTLDADPIVIRRAPPPPPPQRQAAQPPPPAPPAAAPPRPSLDGPIRPTPPPAHGTIDTSDPWQ